MHSLRRRGEPDGEGAFAHAALACTIAHMTTSPSPFHLSLPVRDLAAQRDFYLRVLGCKLCRVGQGFEDFEFLGHQLTFHEKPLGLDLRIDIDWVGWGTMSFWRPWLGWCGASTT
jgi:hypothetical protein